MNNLAKITLTDDVMASRLYDGLQNSPAESVNKPEETVQQEPDEQNSVKKKKFTFKMKKPIFKVKNLGINPAKKHKMTPGALRKNTLVACCVLLIAAAVWLNFTFAETPAGQLVDGHGEDVEAQGKILGESAFVGSEGDVTEDYFSVAVINRQRVRDEAIDMLREVVDNVETNSAIRENAFNEMTRMAGETNSEINIENLVTAKGFEECVAVISGNTANIIVKSDGLLPEHIAQIQEIVYTQSGTAIENIKIIEKQ
ncbi:MAG: SpoIIIAH-like family protein [Ruminococcaceae bacterium]|nr:SpoIIIAH-like family protein [Oscillospiraceae bacterium]